MPLNIEPRNADFIPFAKYNAKAGRWYTRDDTSNEIEVKNMTAIFDLAQIKTGWVYFAEGQAPDAVWDNGEIGPKPSPEHKRGFAVNVFSPQNLGGLREFSSTANGAIIAIKELYDAYENAPEAKEGLVPVVTCEAVLPIKSKFGTNYQPVLKIQKWVRRPDALSAEVSSGKVNPTADAAPRAEQTPTATEF